MFLERTMYNVRKNVDMLNAVKGVLADVLSVSLCQSKEGIMG